MNGIPKLSNKEYLILDQLRSGKAMYGLELVKNSNGNLKRGTVYVTLGRMIDKGFVSSSTEPVAGEPELTRRRYRITAHGAKVFTVLSSLDIGGLEVLNG